jgi:F-type H+-transporting ATPase subunit delta
MRDDISNYFALTVFKLAKKHSKEELADLEKSLIEFAGLISSNKNLKMLFNHPSVSLNEKYEFAGKIVKNVIALKLITLLIRIKKINVIDDISKIITGLIKIDNNLIDAEVKFPIELDKEEEEKIKKAIESYTDKTANLSVTIDPSILGGIYIKIGNNILDYTLIKQLDLFKERFKQK